jgi:hypothetical protein
MQPAWEKLHCQYNSGPWQLNWVLTVEIFSLKSRWSTVAKKLFVQNKLFDFMYFTSITKLVGLTDRWCQREQAHQHLRISGCFLWKLITDRHEIAPTRRIQLYMTPTLYPWRNRQFSNCKSSICTDEQSYSLIQNCCDPAWLSFLTTCGLP